MKNENSKAKHFERAGSSRATPISVSLKAEVDFTLWLVPAGLEADEVSPLRNVAPSLAVESACLTSHAREAFFALFGKGGGCGRGPSL